MPHRGLATADGFTCDMLQLRLRRYRMSNAKLAAPKSSSSCRRRALRRSVVHHEYPFGSFGCPHAGSPGVLSPWHVGAIDGRSLSRANDDRYLAIGAVILRLRTSTASRFPAFGSDAQPDDGTEGQSARDGGVHPAVRRGHGAVSHDLETNNAASRSKQCNSKRFGESSADQATSLRATSPGQTWTPRTLGVTVAETTLAAATCCI